MGQATTFWIALGSNAAGRALPDLFDALETELGPCRFRVTGARIDEDQTRDIQYSPLPAEDAR